MMCIWLISSDIVNLDLYHVTVSQLDAPEFHSLFLLFASPSSFFSTLNSQLMMMMIETYRDDAHRLSQICSLTYSLSSCSADGADDVACTLILPHMVSLRITVLINSLVRSLYHRHPIRYRAYKMPPTITTFEQLQTISYL